MNTWRIISGKHKCFEVFDNGEIGRWKWGVWEIESDTKPEFELIRVPKKFGGDKKFDSIDVYDTEYEMELVDLSHCDYAIPEDGSVFSDHCYIWDFTVKEVA